MKELNYFTIEGGYGGNQDWYKNIVMRIGGCAATTAMDCCIYLALRDGATGLYPYDVRNLTKQDYRDFSRIMKPYLKPRREGVKKLEWFIEGFEHYLDETEQGRRSIAMEPFAGHETFELARAFVKGQIDAQLPIPYLLLRHQNPKYKDYIWHWFLLTGYEEAGEDLLVKTATYGESDVFSLKEMWETGFEEKGGMIRLIPLYERPNIG